MNKNHNFIAGTCKSNLTWKMKLFNLGRFYSTKTPLDLPKPILTINNLHDKQHVLSKRNLLINKAGIYSFLNNINNKQYIGSAKDLYLRLNEHLSKTKSNRALQAAILKYELKNFSFCIYEYFTYDNKITSSKLLTEIETFYIKKFDFTNLYNFMKSATSLEGYKHTEQAKLKMKKRLENKSDHRGKHHDDKTKLLISKPGSLNPMYGKTHTNFTKDLMRSKKKKYENGIGLYDLNNNLVKSFDYPLDLANYLNISKVTVSKYLNKGLVYKDKYYIKII
jgi:group I intron endonuclease